MTIALQKEMERLEKARLREEEQLRKSGSAYELLKKQYNDASKAALDLGARTNANNPEFIAAAQNVKKLHDQLYQLESAIGRNQRNVGNYNGAMVAMNQVLREMPAFANSVQTGIMGISNNLPMLTDEIKKLSAAGMSNVQILKTLGTSFLSIGSILSFVSTAAVLAIQYFNSMEKETEKASDAAGGYADNIKLIAQEIGKETSELSQLYNTATRVTASYKDRGEAVDELQKKWPEHFGALSREKILNGEVADAYDRATQSIIENAKAKGRQALITEKATELAKQQEILDRLKGKDAGPNTFVLASPADIKGQEQRVKMLEAQLSALTKYDQLIQENGETIGYWLDQNQKKEWEALQAKQKANALLTEEERKRLEQLNKQRENADEKYLEMHDRMLLDIHKSNVEAEKLYLEISMRDQQSIINNDKATADEKIQAYTNYMIAKLGLLGLEKQEAMSNAQAEYFAEIDKINKLLIADSKKKELLLLAEKKFQSDLRSIQNNYEVKAYDAQMDASDGILKNTTPIGPSKRAIEIAKKGIEDYQVYRRRWEQQEKKEHDQLTRDKIKNLEAMKQASNAVFNAISQINAESTARNSERISKEKEDIDSKTEKEKQAIEQSTLSSVEKQRKISEVERLAAQKKALLDQEDANRKRKQANYEKGIAILRATIALWEGVSKEIGSKGVIGIGTGAAIVAYMASVIAAVSSTNVPQYAEGTGKDGHKGGPALFGEAGPEGVKEPGKPMYWVTKPTLKNLPKGTHVYPMKRMKEMMSQDYSAKEDISMAPVVQHAYGDTEAILNTLKEIANKPQAVQNVIIDGHGVKKQLLQGSVTLDWLTRNIAD